MVMVDTHTHLYLDAFDDDRAAVIERALNAGVSHALLPNIDSTSIGPMHDMAAAHPDFCRPMMGLHPTSVKDNWKQELNIVRGWLEKGTYCAVGEIGIDLYWDKTFREQQEEAFRIQVGWAYEMGLPVSVHSRDSIEVILRILEQMALPGLKGVFHCFTRSRELAQRIIRLGFHLGIGGVLTYKNAKLCDSLHDIPLTHLVLETDAPFLSPVPYRGQRNESAYLEVIAGHLAGCLGTTAEEVARVTTQNARDLFNLEP